MTTLATLDQAQAAALAIGLTLDVTSRPSASGDLIVVSVHREAADWTLASTQIAIAKTPEDAARRAIAAIDLMAPRIAKQLADNSGEPIEPRESLPIAAGVSSDGTVTTLRVERDGTIRLAPDDIAAIANAVYRRLHPRTKA